MKAIVIILQALFFILISSRAMAYDVEVDGIYYNLNTSKKTAEVTVNPAGKYGYSGDMIIPNYIIKDGVQYDVTVIGKESFLGSQDLLSIQIPNSVVSIKLLAFSNCHKLYSIILGSGLSIIENDAFAFCESLSSIKVNKENKTFDSRDNCNAIIETNTNTLMIGCQNTIIPNTVTAIGDGAFSNCVGLKSIVIPNSVKCIGNHAFMDCNGLSSITIPEGVTSLGDQAFSNCDNLTTLKISKTVSSIGMYAFHECSKLDNVTSEIEKPFNIREDVFYGISYDAVLNVPKGTKDLYQALSGWNKYFKSILEIDNSNVSYGMSISSNGNGMVLYNGSTIRNQAFTFAVNKGISATISFSPDNGYRIKSVKVNSTNVTSSVSNNQYIVSNIQSNTTVEVEFEAIPPATYTLSIKATGNGSATYDGNTIRSKTSTFTVSKGATVTISFAPDNGYKIKTVQERLMLGSAIALSYHSENPHTINNISCDVSIEVEFEEIPPTTYTLTISAIGNGTVSFDGTTIRSTTSRFTVNEGSSPTVTFTPDDGYRVALLMDNGVVVTPNVSGNQYTINNIKKTTSVEVFFAQDDMTFETGGVNYSVVSYENRTVNVSNGIYNIFLEVPNKIVYQNEEWNVVGIDNDALANSPGLAAIIWGPDVNIPIITSNPNFLLYVKSASYAPTTIKNVIVNSIAESIVLTDAASGNNFYCPKEFTAKKISYTHNYKMSTGIGKSQGWETIALPFDVQKITHSSRGELTPFENWKNGDNKKPFWLMSYGTGGWNNANSIKANTPYVISMPNNSEYKAEFRLNGIVTFSSEDVTVKKSDNLQTGSYDGNTFTPNFIIANNSDYKALNVDNDYEAYKEKDSAEGSKFGEIQRTIHPFEAYMTTVNKARKTISIDGDMTTGIEEMFVLMDENKELRIYNLKGQLMKVDQNKGIEEVKSSLPAGVYIVKGKKLIIK